MTDGRWGTPGPVGTGLDPILSAHGPPDARGQLGAGSLEALSVGGSTSIEAAVVVGDLRMSTLILREAVRPALFARFIVGFTEAVRELAHTSNGWFDKFTGDGFIAFWIYPADGGPDLARICDFCQSVLPAADALLENLRRNSRNFPAGAGLSLGIDAGPCELVRVGAALTVVGSPTVGATRMVASARAKQTFVNVLLGERLAADPELLRGLGIRIAPAVARTKEFPEGQEAFLLEFPPTHRGEGAGRRGAPAGAPA